VVRDGRHQNTLASNLVPGDLIHFGIGDRIPADARLVHSSDLEIDESMLTGENKAVKKSHGFICASSHTAIVDRKNIVFMGTLVKQGNGKAIVLGTGKNTEFGVVFSMMKDTEEPKTPLQVKMDQLGQQLSYISFGVIGIIVLLGLFQKRPWLELFTIAVSLAVAAIPEGLPIVVTVTLALGVIRLSKKHVIVKKLLSVEALGSVDTICIDKTGTLTMNRMTVTTIFLSSTKNAYDCNNLDANTQQNQNVLFTTANLCNNAYELEKEFLGNSTEAALMNFLVYSLQFSDKRKELERTDELPFNSDNKFMAVAYNDAFNEKIYHVKGAPEVVISKCKYNFYSNELVALLTKADIEIVQTNATQLSKQGLRVIAFAYGSSLDELVFTGLIAMHDPPRPGVKKAIQMFRQSGIKVMMITGDSRDTAVSIAQKCGLEHSDKVLSAEELEALNEIEILDNVEHLNILYRATPKDKVTIIKSLQRMKHVVAMTGDGVNDGPALKLSDLGISMGKSGTDVSKEASKLILVDDQLESLISALEEGKSIFYNIRGFLRFQLSTR
jgi:Ca2+-transporting ATPase